MEAVRGTEGPFCTKSEMRRWQKLQKNPLIDDEPIKKDPAKPFTLNRINPKPSYLPFSLLPSQVASSHDRFTFYHSKHPALFSSHRCPRARQGGTSKQERERRARHDSSRRCVVHLGALRNPPAQAGLKERTSERKKLWGEKK